jgi:hypothetical protein
MAAYYGDLGGLYGIEDPANSVGVSRSELPDYATIRTPPAMPPAPPPRAAPAMPLDERAYDSPLAVADAEGLQRLDDQFADIGYPDPGTPLPSIGDLPPRDPAAEAMQGAGAFASEGDALRAAADQKIGWSSPNPTYGPTQEYVESMRELLPEDERLLRERQEAEAAERRIAAFEIQQRADQMQRQIVDQKAAHHARNMEMQEAQENVKKSLTAMEDAAKQVREAQELDPDKWWSDKTTGQKIVSFISLALVGIGSGMAGKPEQAAQFRDNLMQREIEKQKEGYKRLQDQYGASADVVGAYGNLFSQTMAKVQDERQAELVVNNSVLEAMQAEFEARVAQAGVQTLTAEQAEVMNGIKQQIAQNKMQLEILARTTPKRIGGTAYARPPEERAALTRAAARADKTAEKYEDLGFSVMKDREIDSPKEERAEIRKHQQATHAAAEARVGSMSKDLGHYQAGIETADQVLQMLKDHGGLPKSWTADRKKINALAKSLGIEKPEDYWRADSLRAEIEAQRDLLQGEDSAARRYIESEQHERVFGRERQHGAIRTPESAQGAPSAVRED